MRLVVERDQLVEAVSWTARGLASRPTVPVLAGVLIEAGERLTLTTFDAAICTRSAVEATVTHPGRVLVSGRLLSEIVRHLPAEPVTLSTVAGNVVLTCGGYRFTLLMLPVEEFPALPEAPTPGVVLGADVFCAAVAQVTVAAGRDDSLPLLTAVRMVVEGDTLAMACTDRYRIAVRRVECRTVLDGPPASPLALVSARVLADAAKSLRGGDMEVGLGFGEGLFGIEAGGRRLVTRLIDAQAPDYPSLVPAPADWRAEVERGPLVEAVKRVALVAAPHTPLRLVFGGGEVHLEAATGQEAHAVATLPATLHGDELTVAFMPGYLLDGLTALDSDLAVLHVTDPRRPVLFTGKEGQHGLRYVLMPLRR